MQYNITYRIKDESWQFIISYKDNDGKWKQKSKQGFPLKKSTQKSNKKVSEEKDKKPQIPQEVKEAAIATLEELKKKIGLSIDLNKEHDGITFKQYTKMFIEHEKLYKENNTVRGYDIAINAFEGLHKLELTKITNTDIQRCIDELIKSKKANSTIKIYLARVSIVFDLAINLSKILIESPVKNITLPKDKANTEKKALTKLELDTLLSRISNRKYYIISLIASKCGLRLGEILGLTWEDINEKKCTITVNKQWKYLKTGKYGSGPVKSINSNRVIPISPKVLAELLEYDKETPRNIDKRIFDNKYNDSVIKSLIRIYKAAGFDISIHELRHTFATNLISNGMDFKMAADLLGHDVKETYKTYSHVNSDMREKAAEIINLI